MKKTNNLIGRLLKKSLSTYFVLVIIAGALHVLTHFTFLETTKGYYYYFHFIDEIIEMQRGEVTCPSSSSLQMIEPIFEIRAEQMERYTLFFSEIT